MPYLRICNNAGEALSPVRRCCLFFEPPWEYIEEVQQSE